MINGTVYIVDDDFAVRDGLRMLCEAEDLKVECYDSAEAFLEQDHAGRTGCLVLDVRMGTMSGPELHAELNKRGSRLPIIFLTAHGTIPMSVTAIKDGAIDFLTKPVDGNQLLDRIDAALTQNREAAQQLAMQAENCRWLETLTPREQTIMALAIAGHKNKEIARNLGISHRTVELHRSRILRKARVDNILALTQVLSGCGNGKGEQG